MPSPLGPPPRQAAAAASSAAVWAISATASRRRNPTGTPSPSRAGELSIPLRLRPATLVVAVAFSIPNSSPPLLWVSPPLVRPSSRRVVVAAFVFRSGRRVAELKFFLVGAVSERLVSSLPSRFACGVESPAAEVKLPVGLWTNGENALPWKGDEKGVGTLHDLIHIYFYQLVPIDSTVKIIV
ncbi:hypothetical protein [Oryza sativa Japonica Group]|uniref:Uncharacterized protein P0408G07.14 n=1 Tax=Oryza sativa subsp. japonica TaxID=39947 RepID=Q5N8H3_ORYSJ|nr:hypothetical protein [Oryza sativa Japonica Group]